MNESIGSFCARDFITGDANSNDAQLAGLQLKNSEDLDRFVIRGQKLLTRRLKVVDEVAGTGAEKL